MDLDHAALDRLLRFNPEGGRLEEGGNGRTNSVLL